MGTRREYSEETKAAVMAALLTGQSVSAAAREYDIPKGTVSGWKEAAHAIPSGVAEAATQKREAIGAALLAYVEASLRTLKVQVEHFGNPTWLDKQAASEVAVLHGVIADKAIRLLEALAGDGASDVP